MSRETDQRKIPIGNSFGFQTQIENLRLKCGIEKENPQKTLQEERIGFRGEFVLQPDFKKWKRGMFVHTVAGG
jgi:hypothetical protein